MALRPMFNRIKVQPDIKSTVTTGGILLPDSKKEERNEVGTVVSIGRGVECIQVGDRVLYGRYAGFTRLELPNGEETESKTEGTVFHYMNEEDVVGIFEHE